MWNRYQLNRNPIKISNYKIPNIANIDTRDDNSQPLMAYMNELSLNWPESLAHYSSATTQWPSLLVLVNRERNCCLIRTPVELTNGKSTCEPSPPFDS